MRNYEPLQPMVATIIENIEKVIVGKQEVAKLSVVALLAGGHVLLEDVPGVGKTMLVRALSTSINGQFRRIQFTPDLLPSDVLGVSIYNQKEMRFEYKAGPIMGHIILADEINRTSPKTQSALLEAMEEGNVTVDGVTRPLPRPFFVMATQNPIEYEGTYPLPEAQLDRFLLKLKIGYPSPQQEIDILSRMEHSAPIDALQSVMDVEELLQLQKSAQSVYVDERVKRYIVDIVQRSRSHASVYLGVSPRGSIALMKAAQAYAFMHERDFVIPDDVQLLAPYVLSHRIILKPDAKFDGMSAEQIVAEIVARTPVPFQR